MSSRRFASAGIIGFIIAASCVFSGSTRSAQAVIGSPTTGKPSATLEIPKDLRDDPSLPPDERNRRRKERLRLITEARSKAAKEIGEKPQREFQAALERTVSLPAHVGLQRLQELRDQIGLEIEALQTSMTRQRDAYKAAEAELARLGSPDAKEARDDPTLSHEERLKRQQRRMKQSAAQDSLKRIADGYVKMQSEMAWHNERLNRIADAAVELKAMEVTLVPDSGASPDESKRPSKRRITPPRETDKSQPQLSSAAGETTPSATNEPLIIPAPPEPTYAARPLVVGFVLDRALDLCDLLRFRLHAPRGYRGVGVKARATCLAQLGFVFFDGRSLGVDRRGAGIWREWRLEGGVGPIYGSRVKDEMIAGNHYTDARHPWTRMYRRGIVRNGVFWDDGRLHPLSTGAELQLFVFGVELEVYPLELLDAAIGWIGLDSANDDESRIIRRWNEWQTIPELRVRDEWKEALR